jgi:hypothetical protein
MSFNAPVKYMVNHPTLGMGEGNNGYFCFERNGITFHVISSDGAGWEHVSVSLNKKRCPTWDEMCMIKDLFWDKDDCVIQYHPPKSEYVNNVSNCLHMWRPIGKELPIPPSILVGLK